MGDNQSDPDIRLAPRPHESDFAAEFHSHGRVQIPAILDERSADSIYNYLSNLRQWNLVFSKHGQHIDTDAESVLSWSQDERNKLEDIIHSQAADGFQYHYAAVPIYDMYHQAQIHVRLIAQIFEFVNSDGFLNLLRTITRDDSIAFADAQATRYSAGHFLTRHDDSIGGKNRRIAYVLNLTRDWNADWGGALQFFDSRGNIEYGFAPSFNALNLFRIPASHSVALVAPFAKASRYSITGWARSGKDPMLAG